jgi:hypothetical protein
MLKVSYRVVKEVWIPMLRWINSIRRVHHRSRHEYLCVVTVGDSPQGPLKNRGNPAHNLQKTKTKHTSYLNVHAGRGPRRGGPRGPPEWPRQRLPLSRLRLARGLTPPSSRLRLARGLTPPRTGSASLEAHAPLERVPPRSTAHAPL